MYTIITVIIEKITVYGGLIGQTDESVQLLTPELVASFTIGQKLTFADWIIYILYMWALKSAMLSIYWGLAKGLPKYRIMVLTAMAFVFLTFIASLLTHICGCLPVRRNWQIVPYPGGKLPLSNTCALRNLNYYVIGILNAVSDGVIVCIPIPIIAKTNLSIWRKLLLMVLLGCGGFIIIATILRTYYSLKSISLLPVAAGWTSREMFVAAVAVSAPGIKPLFSPRKWFRSTKRSAPSTSDPRQGAFELSNQDDGRPWRIGAGKKDARGTRLSSDNGSEDLIIDRTQAARLKHSHEVDVAKTYSVDTDGSER
ncbi:srpk [Fusarium albosuccineum]|uniref:Srpk n=1 Tax=Fusarium albosuccineum TaxID=1237068 RepID=A0A8H4PDY7_9HYPO|nr:srpk [Fusarium albosuccineum]